MHFDFAHRIFRWDSESNSKSHVHCVIVGFSTAPNHKERVIYTDGRLKSDYRYSKDIVYNNFPWPFPTSDQRAKIEQAVQAILAARALYSGSSLADRYDELTMPPELRRTHQNNDCAVMAAYGFPVKGFTEADCVAELMKLYQKMGKEAGK